MISRRPGRGSRCGTGLEDESRSVHRGEEPPSAGRGIACAASNHPSSLPDLIRAGGDGEERAPLAGSSAATGTAAATGTETMARNGDGGDSWYGGDSVRRGQCVNATRKAGWRGTATPAATASMACPCVDGALRPRCKWGLAASAWTGGVVADGRAGIWPSTRR